MFLGLLLLDLLVESKVLLKEWLVLLFGSEVLLFDLDHLWEFLFQHLKHCTDSLDLVAGLCPFIYDFSDVWGLFWPVFTEICELVSFERLLLHFSAKQFLSLSIVLISQSFQLLLHILKLLTFQDDFPIGNIHIDLLLVNRFPHTVLQLPDGIHEFLGVFFRQEKLSML